MKRTRAPSVTKPVESHAQKKTRVLKLFRSVRPPTGFPKSMTMRHRYVQTGTLTSTTGVTAKYAFNLNGMYDPDVTGTGHQPLYFDQQSLMYDHWVVTKSFFRVSFAPGNDSTKPAYVGLLPDDDGTTSLVNHETLSEQTGAQVKFMFSDVDAAEPVVLTTKYDAVKNFGPDPQDNNSLQGTSAANPSETSCVIIWIVAADGTTTISCYYLVEIWYEAIWTEIKTIATS